MILFSALEHEDCSAAYNWHRGFAGANDSLFPRPHEEFQELVMNGCVWAARETNGDFVALAYAAYNETNKECELGGLMVSVQARGKGIGAIIMFLALIHAIVEEDLLNVPDVRIISHVLKSNNEPRKIIVDRLKFSLAKEVEIPAEALPGLKADADGLIRGDEFELTIPDTLIALRDWVSSWHGGISQDGFAVINLRSGVEMSDWLRVLEDLLQSRH